MTSAKLLEELTAAAGDKTLPSKIRRYRSLDLLIIDEFGFDKLERRVRKYKEKLVDHHARDKQKTRFA